MDAELPWSPIDVAAVLEDRWLAAFHDGDRAVIEQCYKPAELPPEIGNALEPCHLARSETGTLRVKLESYGSEIADVVTEGGDAGDHRCAEEALWATALPDHFNDDRSWSRVDYAFALARSPAADASP